MQKLVVCVLILTFLAADVRAADDCKEGLLKNYQRGPCESGGLKRILYSKMCIDEFEARNYTLAWTGSETIACVSLETNGPVFFAGGGSGYNYTYILIESVQGRQLVWEASIYAI